MHHKRRNLSRNMEREKTSVRYCITYCRVSRSHLLLMGIKTFVDPFIPAHFMYLPFPYPSTDKTASRHLSSDTGLCQSNIHKVCCERVQQQFWQSSSGRLVFHFNFYFFTTTTGRCQRWLQGQYQKGWVLSDCCRWRWYLLMTRPDLHCHFFRAKEQKF